MNKFRITCQKCKGSDDLVLSSSQVFYTKHTPIIAARLRPDDNWGFQCTCGNDSRLSIEEKDQIDILVRGSSKSIVEQMKKSVVKGNEKRFKMQPL